jgi:replicative DNA helicase
MRNKKAKKIPLADWIPHKPQLEESVLGCVLLDNKCWDDISDIINQDDFYDYKHKAIYRACEKLMSEGKPVDFVTLPSEIERFSEGGIDWPYQDSKNPEPYLIDLYRNTPTSASVVHYAKLLRKVSMDRKLVNIAKKIPALVAEDVDNRLDTIQQEVINLGEVNEARPILFRELTGNLLSEIMDRHDRQEEHNGLKTGYIDLDALTLGFKPGDLVILAARPSMGKTQLSLNIAEHVALEQKKTVLIFSLEMSSQALGYRFLSSVSGIKSKAIATGKFQDEDINHIIDAAGLLNDSKLIFHDAACTSSSIRSKARQVKRQHGLDLIIVDYLQLITGYNNLQQIDRITNISRDLKLIAKEIGVPLIALSQLNRALEQRTDKRPKMSDLRDSGSIEQDADMILFIYRDEVYDKCTMDKGVAEIIVAKNRDGSTGDIKLAFKGDHCRFDNYTKRYEPVAQKPKQTDKTYKKYYDDFD